MRALLRSDRADDELAKALARAGLYVERISPHGSEASLGEKLAAPDLAVVDPRLLAFRTIPGASATAATSAAGDARARGPGGERSPEETEGDASLEEVCANKIEALLDRLGDQTLPDLYETVIGEVERALFRVVLERVGSVGAAAELLGIHRNTLSRKLVQLGLREPSSRRRA